MTLAQCWLIFALGVLLLAAGLSDLAAYSRSRKRAAIMRRLGV